MTPEIKAAMERVRRLDAGEPFAQVYGCEPWTGMLSNDLAHLGRAFLAEHADDDEPVTLDWMESVVPEDGSLTIEMRDGVGRVYLGESDLCDGVKIKTRRQLRELLKGLGQ